MILGCARAVRPMWRPRRGDEPDVVEGERPLARRARRRDGRREWDRTCRRAGPRAGARLIGRSISSTCGDGCRRRAERARRRCAATPLRAARHALAGDRGDRGRTAAPARARAPRQRVDARRIVERVDLVGRHELRLLEQRGIVERELAANRVEVLDRIAARRAGDVDEMNQHLRALDVTQELMAETVSFVRAFDQPGDVGDDEAALVAQRDDAEMRRERRERDSRRSSAWPPRCAR